MNLDPRLLEDRIRFRWFWAVRREFGRRAMEFAGKPIVYVEVGCWYGASAWWMCDRVLTHPEARGYGIDPYLPEPKHDAEYMGRVRLFARRLMRGKRWTWIYAQSQQALQSHSWDNRRSIDLLYLDGLHTASGVLSDWCLAWPYLKVGSGVILDDYFWGRRKPHSGVAEAVEAIKMTFGGMVEPWGDVSGTPFQYGFKVVSKNALDCKFKVPKK